MPVTPASGQALTGIQRGLDGLQRSGAEIAGAGRMNGAGQHGVSEALVEQVINAAQVDASVKVLRTEHGMLLGSLLDVRA